MEAFVAYALAIALLLGWAALKIRRALDRKADEIPWRAEWGKSELERYMEGRK
jgi:hypothetical protein